MSNQSEDFERELAAKKQVLEFARKQMESSQKVVDRLVPEIEAMEQAKVKMIPLRVVSE